MKKALLMLFAILTMLSFSTGVSAQEVYKMGDANKDGVISVMDATMVQCLLAGLVDAKSVDTVLADVDGKDGVNVLDATTIQLYLAQIIDGFPNENTTQTPSIDSDGYYDQIVKP